MLVKNFYLLQVTAFLLLIFKCYVADDQLLPEYF